MVWHWKDKFHRWISNALHNLAPVYLSASRLPLPSMKVHGEALPNGGSAVRLYRHCRSVYLGQCFSDSPVRVTSSDRHRGVTRAQGRFVPTSASLVAKIQLPRQLWETDLKGAFASQKLNGVCPWTEHQGEVEEVGVNKGERWTAMHTRPKHQAVPQGALQ